ncbi:hypothetical protein BO79DRAFT_200138 [Aspergillus costaricaensis CBS 115574]|uniref:Uncharacterized protein n=1 Tax=Aspergillus costaricaensis CBS 115574 TaxID=1448317 RepID=A0ACD1I5Z3_9EURO|nr:hypothetical protein BO79DRAFT_200138 [Aspergillus costaricaensis CBS 115574]RAK85987.1 hypothetical protein BO79DRAFT_200138 [Aspergillus costaricaensis CBS 115574]
MSQSTSHVLHHIHKYISRSDSTTTSSSDLTVQAKHGPIITLRTLFSRNPIPNIQRQSLSIDISPSDEESQPPPAYTHPHTSLETGSKGNADIPPPQQAHIPPSLRKELNLHVDTSHSHTTTAAIATTKPKPTPLRTMSDTEILKSSTSTSSMMKDREARSTLKVQIHHHHHHLHHNHNHPYYSRLRVGSPRSPKGNGSGAGGGNKSDRLCPPDEYAVPPDSPDVIVLPSPRELQKFRINVYR